MSWRFKLWLAGAKTNRDKRSVEVDRCKSPPWKAELQSARKPRQMFLVRRTIHNVINTSATSGHGNRSSYSWSDRWKSKPARLTTRWRTQKCCLVTCLVNASPSADPGNKAADYSGWVGVGDIVTLTAKLNPRRRTIQHQTWSGRRLIWCTHVIGNERWCCCQFWVIRWFSPAL